jgi:hypothetical protein
MNHLDRNNRQPFEEIVIRSVKQLEIDPKKTPRKILPRTKSEDKIEEKYFLLKGKQKLLAQKSQVQNEIIQSKALDALINEKKILNKIKSDVNVEQDIKSNQNIKKNLSKNFLSESDFYSTQKTPMSSNLINQNKSSLKKDEIKKQDESYEVNKTDEILSGNLNSENPLSKSKFGKEKKYLDNFMTNSKNYKFVVEREEIDDDYNNNNFTSSASKSIIKNSNLVTNSGGQSKIKSYFKDSKARIINNKSKNKIASKRKQEDLTFSEEEQLKLSHKKKKNFR